MVFHRHAKFHRNPIVRVQSYDVIAIFKMAAVSHVGFGDIIYRSNPEKAPPCAETREDRPSGWTWASTQDKRTGQSKSHKSIIFHTLGEKRDLRRNLRGSCRPRSNHVCRVLNSNFQFVTVLQISDFPIDSRIGLAKVLR